MDKTNRMGKLSQTPIIPMSLFNALPAAEGHDQETNRVSKKRETSLMIPFACFGTENDNTLNNDEISCDPAQAMCQALLVLSCNNNRSDESYLQTPMSKSALDSASVSTATTSPISECESETEQDDFPIITQPPDALFLVQGRDFPCHTNVLAKECRPLLDILSTSGVLERKTKKQRTSSGGCNNEELPAWSSPSGIMVARLPEDIDPALFGALMEYLYMREIRIPPSEEKVEEEQEDWGWLMGGEDILDGRDDFEDDGDAEGDDFSVFELSTQEDDDGSCTETPLQFLQKVFLLAQKFCCFTLKQAIEEKIYNEFLFELSAEDLLLWADEHECAFLKEKAMDKIITSAIKKNKTKNHFCRKIYSSSCSTPKLRRLQDEIFVYENEGCYKIECHDMVCDDEGYEDRNYFYKVAYLRQRLLTMGLSTDGTRQMLEERLAPHLRRKSRQFLPTKLTRRLM